MSAEVLRPVPRCSAIVPPATYKQGRTPCANDRGMHKVGRRWFCWMHPRKP